MLSEIKDMFELANILLVPILWYIIKTDRRLTKLEIIQELQLNRKRAHDITREE